MDALSLAILGLLAATATAQSQSSLRSASSTMATSASSVSQSLTPTSGLPPRHHGLSAGAKAGIGVGVGVGVLAILSALLCGYFLMRRRSKSKQMDMYHEPESKRVKKPVPMSNPAPQYPTMKPQNAYTTSQPQSGYSQAHGTYVS
ncbi:hypothetical protein LTR50_007839 [Elasticomyces elasticus]|nr:hypothetical protein LTR50_007839 [Elasticomyces elasticus]